MSKAEVSSSDSVDNLNVLIFKRSVESITLSLFKTKLRIILYAFKIFDLPLPLAP